MLKPITFLILMSASLSLAGPALGETRISVPTMRVQAQGQSEVLEWEGVIQAVKQSTVAAQVPGNVTALLVKAGDQVKAGQALARLDERIAAANLARSQADLAQAEALLAQASQQWQRQQALKAQGFISSAALDAAQAQWRAAQASAAAAQAGQRQAGLAKDFAVVTAPFDGRVLATHVEVGELASPGRPILTLYAPMGMRASVQIPASRVDQVRGAGLAEVQLASTKPASESTWVRAIRVQDLPATDAVSQTVEWRLDLPPSSALPGQTVRVRFSGLPQPQDMRAAAQAGLQVPATAIVQRGELTAVYVVREGHFMLQAVRLATPIGKGAVTVISGLRAGERIALDALKAGLANASPATP